MLREQIIKKRWNLIGKFYILQYLVQILEVLLQILDLRLQAFNNIALREEKAN